MFEVKVKYTKQLEDGTLKRVTEPYIVNAQSFTDAETMIYAQVGEFVRGEFIVTAIKRDNIVDIFEYEDSETWYEGRISFSSLDADSGKSKEVTHKMLVTANSVKGAYNRFGESLADMLSQYEVKSVKETQIQGILLPQEEEVAVQ